MSEPTNDAPVFNLQEDWKNDNPLHLKRPSVRSLIVDYGWIEDKVKELYAACIVNGDYLRPDSDVVRKALADAYQQGVERTRQYEHDIHATRQHTLEDEIRFLKLKLYEKNEVIEELRSNIANLVHESVGLRLDLITKPED